MMLKPTMARGKISHSHFFFISSLPCQEVNHFHTLSPILISKTLPIGDTLSAIDVSLHSVYIFYI
jgi:hypothetical protein